MSMQDLLSDAIARIKNAQRAKHAYTIVSHSRFVESVLCVLKKEGFIEDYSEVENDGAEKILKVDLKYHQGESVIKEIKRLSRPGRRDYSSIADLPKSYGGLGVLILSTSKGIMSDFEARANNVGGELLCEVY